MLISTINSISLISNINYTNPSEHHAKFVLEEDDQIVSATGNFIIHSNNSSINNTNELFNKHINFSRDCNKFVSNNVLSSQSCKENFQTIIVNTTYTDGHTQIMENNLTQTLSFLNTNGKYTFNVTVGATGADVSYVEVVGNTEFWKDGDKIILFDNSYESYTYMYNASKNLWVAVNPYYFQSTSPVNIYAYYAPYLLDGNTKINTSKMQITNETQRDIDFLYSSITISYNTPASFVFQHCMSNLLICIQISNFSNWKFYLSGIIHEGTFNTNNGTTSIDSTALPLDEWDITNNTYYDNIKNNTRTYKMILFPQSLKNGILFTAISDEYSYNETIKINELLPGVSYQHNITLSFIEGYSNPFLQSNTFTQSNTLTKSNSFIKSNEYTQSNKLTKSNSLIQSSINRESIIFESNINISYVLIKSYYFTETIVLNSFISNTLTASFVDSKYSLIYTEFIYYQYQIVEYSTIYSYYSKYFLMNNEDNSLENKQPKHIIIIVVCCVIVVIIIVIIIIIFIIRNHQNKINEIKYEESDNYNEEKEPTNNTAFNIKMTHVEEDPFAKDFKEDNIIEHI